MKRLWIALWIAALIGAPAASALAEESGGSPPPTGEAAYFRNIDLFVSGTEGYHTFRIPSVLTTAAGTLLAFAEGRVNGASDTGDIDLVLKRSFDGGRTWQPLQVVCDAGPDTCGNPTPVQDESTGRLWLFMTRNYGEDTITEINNGTSRGVRTIWSAYSDDDGATWSEPVDRFAEVQSPDTRWDATGPGIGIQLRHGPARGRLVIPAIGRNLQSDDHGATWYESGRLPGGLNEATVVELTDGTLMRNDRLSANQHLKRRAVSTSTDQGATWSGIEYVDALIDPICEASIVRYRPADNAEGDKTLLFANPAHTERRENMTVRISYDDGRTWTVAKTAYKGPSAYSSLTVQPDGNVSLLFEGGEYTPYDKIMFATFNLAWFQVPEADLDRLLFSDGSLTPAFRGDVEAYTLALYRGTNQVTITPVASERAIEISIDGTPAASGAPRTIDLNGVETIAVETRLGERTRSYAIALDRTRAAPELLMHWSFDGADASGIPDDAGRGHVGILNGGADIRPGMDGDALYLDGRRSYAEISNAEALHPGKENFTYSVWVNPDALVQQRHLLYWYGSNGKVPQWWFSVERNGAVRMNMYGLPADREIGVATAAGLVKPGRWTHLAAVRDGSVNKIYVNGELSATSVKYDGEAMDLTNRTAPPLVGFDKGVVANRDWTGHMDELRIYKHALNDADVRKLYWHGDRTKPTTAAAASPGEPNGANGWYTSDVSVTLSAADDLSGIARTEYRVNGGSWAAYAGHVLLAEEGEHTLEYRSEDAAGNVEETRSMAVRIDKTAPALRVSADPSELWAPNGELTPIRTAVAAEDDASGIERIVLDSIQIDDDGGSSPGVESREVDIADAAFGADDREFSLRAERNGGGAGRTYTIKYAATDRAGHVAEATAVVFVAHDRSFIDERKDEVTR
ncbi:exo-alpha-sialidase [Paenibacillus sp.]|uniref:exo-alpha-sialidase n=1 Tax=Paenibacillus sp. TaxID=58172 RepID=UPI002811F170|nr:exo-alpha-sialidase [Paenibacillus sp.]